MTKGGNDLLTGLTGLADFIAVGPAVAAFFVYNSFIKGEKIMPGVVGFNLPSVPG